MAENFTYYSPTEVVFGTGTHKETGNYIRKYQGSKVLVVYGSGHAVKSGLIEEVTESLKNVGVEYELLGGVVPNPHLSKVYEGIEVGKRIEADFLLAVGGGSVIDTAKAIAYGLAEPEKDVWTLFEHVRKAERCLPVASVLTIAAAGSETSMGSVITNERTGEKRAYDDDLSRPKFAIMNPELTLSLSDYQTESGCADILMHTMERYFTGGDTMELTDAIAEGLMCTVMKYAKILHEDPQNLEARTEIMWAGSVSHNGLTGCGTDGGDWATHNMEHEMGGMFDVAHGAGLAAIWGSWARYVSHAAPERFEKFACNVFNIEKTGNTEEIIEKGIQAMEAFYRSVQMPTSMEELGIIPSDAQIEQMAESCERATGGANGSVIPLKKNDMIQIYKMAR